MSINLTVFSSPTAILSEYKEAGKGSQPWWGGRLLLRTLRAAVHPPTWKSGLNDSGEEVESALAGKHSSKLCVCRKQVILAPIYSLLAPNTHPLVTKSLLFKVSNGLFQHAIISKKAGSNLRKSLTKTCIGSGVSLRPDKVSTLKNARVHVIFTSIGLTFYIITVVTFSPFPSPINMRTRCMLWSPYVCV